MADHLKTVLSSGFDESHAQLEINAHMADSWMRYERRFQVSPNSCCILHENLYKALSTDHEAVDFGAVHIPLETSPSSSTTTENEQKQFNSNTQNDNLNKPSTDSTTANSKAPVDSKSTSKPAETNKSNPDPSSSAELRAPAKKRKFKDTLQI